MEKINEKTSELPLSTLIYQYFFYKWLFKPVIGTQLEQAAAFRFNISHKNWILVYIKRWVFIAALSFTLMCVLDKYFDSDYFAAFFAMLFSFSFTTSLFDILIYIGLAKSKY